MNLTDPPRRRGRPPAPRPAGDPVEEPRVEAVERALSLLEAFADGTPRLALSEIAARSGLYPSTALRLAASLARFGYLQRDTDGAFRLGPAPLRLGLLYQGAFNLADHVRPALAQLTARTGETSGFYVREGDDRICLFRHHSERLIRHHIEEGARLPLDRGASARVLAAFTGDDAPRSAEVRAQGFAVSLGERDPETAAIAAPVFGRDGFLGALGLAGPRHRLDEPRRAALAEAVVAGARALSHTLGSRRTA